mmetsp:Transcript_31761/g.52508  ORF Transcript_31761/g.52508 Transcript_31761/m.52508 type:complete len:364 (-) Transcript_31761:216-1307(-)
MLSRLLVIALLATVTARRYDGHGDRKGKCRGKGDEGKGHGGKGHGGKGQREKHDHEKWSPESSEGHGAMPDNDEARWLEKWEHDENVKGELGARADRLWSSMSSFYEAGFEADELLDLKRRFDEAQEGHEKLRLAFELVLIQSEYLLNEAPDSEMEAFANKLWSVFDEEHAEEQDKAWQELEGNPRGRLRLALKLMRGSAKAEMSEGEKAGMFWADWKSAEHEWKSINETGPTTNEASRLLLGCISTVADLEMCALHASWMESCLECEDEQNDAPSRDPPIWVWPLISLVALGITAIVFGLIGAKVGRLMVARKTAAMPIAPAPGMKVVAAQAVIDKIVTAELAADLAGCKQSGKLVEGSMCA